MRLYSVLKGHCITTHRNAVGTKSLRHRPERAVHQSRPNALRSTQLQPLPFQGDCLVWRITHRVAVGCYALPL
ncbi:MAG: hypothetical protein LBC02_03215, partial [Planctomycetaceae bacterium]|nr:hypothetical protein [Planctomycetaceae bacterium]